VKQSIVACLFGALAAAGCAPVFSDLQSARLAGQGRVELTPSASFVDFSDEGTNHIQDQFGVQVATGVHERVDLRFRYEQIRVAGEEWDDAPPADLHVNVVGFGPKLSLVKDRLALAVPAGFAFGGDIESGETWEIQPTLIGTLPITRHLELTLAGKYIIPLTADDGDNLVALNLGLGAGKLDRWAVRPEIGFLWNPGEEGHFRHLSLGFSFLFGRR
jgi:hypothetical protein